MRRTGLLLAATIAVLASPAAGKRPAAAPNPVAAENARAGVQGWLLPEETGQAIEGYVSELSALPGDTVHFHVSTQPVARYRIQVYRLGWYGGAGARLAGCLPGCATDEQGAKGAEPAIQPSGLIQPNWPATDSLTVGADWVTGYYLAELVLTSGPQAGRAARVFFVVRVPPTARRSAILVQVPVATWEAYNGWGGKSLYESTSADGRRAYEVSFDRPFAWAQAGGPMVWEIQLVRFLEREGYDVSYETDVDTVRDPGSLLRHRLLMVAGHDEYWTKEERDAFDAARDKGTNLAFMGANDAYWQIRYLDGEHTILAYKSLYDPNPDPALKTAMFRELTPPRYECELMGIQSQGVGLTWKPGDYSVVPAALRDPWFAKTGFTATTTLRGLVSVESDTIPGNQTAASSCGHQLTVFFHRETGSDKSGNADATRYVAASGARVFASGSHQFSWGLDGFDPEGLRAGVPAVPGLQQFLRNALADLLRPAPPTAIAARLTARGVELRIRLPVDPRVRNARVERIRGGRSVFACSTVHGRCVDRTAPRGTYRYAASSVDRWGRSTPLLSQLFTVRTGR